MQALRIGQPLDGVERVAHFLSTGKHFRGYARRLMAHQARFLWRYRNSFRPMQSIASSLCLGSLVAPTQVSNPRYALWRTPPRTHISPTERLDPAYQPQRRVDAAYRSFFEPTMVTDPAGELNELLADDLLAERYRQRAAVC